jgi:hypothetical protein
LPIEILDHCLGFLKKNEESLMVLMVLLLILIKRYFPNNTQMGWKRSTPDQFKADILILGGIIVLGKNN